MVDAPEFKTLEHMESSSWLVNTQELMKFDQWPRECIRCQEIEEEDQESIRIHALALKQQTIVQNYLQVGGVLDNVCNAACLTCNENLSTRIGSLKGRVFPIIDNSSSFWKIPQHRIVHLDINGGEPSYSKNYRQILNNLPPNLKTLRLNTNGSTVLTELVQIADKGVDVTVTVSCDGIKEMHELNRWPISWPDFYKNLMIYKTMPVKLNLWTTVSRLNVNSLEEIQQFAKDHGIDHNYAYLKQPFELSVDNLDDDIAASYISKQKQLRGIV
jgi:sulfatase maturation enzyme AslB (radical SAM superfamily)